MSLYDIKYSGIFSIESLFEQEIFRKQELSVYMPEKKFYTKKTNRVCVHEIIHCTALQKGDVI